MIFELAPMEAITTYIYRNALHRYFPGIDVFFSPFISLQNNKSLNFKELKELDPKNNQGMKLIPQVLTNNAEDFLYVQPQLMELGYTEMNLNYGCPSGTVTTKFKGSGIFKDLDRMDEMLYKIFEASKMKVSVKTRVGFENDDEWEKIKKIYMKYPIDELIIHPRVRQDFYNGFPRPELLAEIKELMPNTKISYNGNIYDENDYNLVLTMGLSINAVMIGRGIITNPALAAILKGKSFSNEEFKKLFKEFHNEILSNYIEIMPGDRPTLFKMKELWSYMINLVDEPETCVKKIRKANSCNEYKSVMTEVLPKINLSAYSSNLGISHRQ